MATDSQAGVGVGTPATPGAIQSDVIPLFQTRIEVLKVIRMYTAVDEQTNALMDHAITDVRLEFYNALGSDRVVQIQGYYSIANPVTEEELVKTSAKLAEAYWVMYKLIPLLPVNFLENNYNVRENFNEEPLTRDATAVEKLQATLLAVINTNLNRLMEPAIVGDGTFDTAVTQREDTEGDADPYIVAENFIGQYYGDL